MAWEHIITPLHVPLATTSLVETRNLGCLCWIQAPQGMALKLVPIQYLLLRHRANSTKIRKAECEAGEKVFGVHKLADIKTQEHYEKYSG